MTYADHIDTIPHPGEYVPCDCSLCDNLAHVLDGLCVPCQMEEEWAEDQAFSESHSIAAANPSLGSW